MENIATTMNVVTRAAIADIDTERDMNLGRRGLVVIEERDIENLYGDERQHEQYFQMDIHLSRSIVFGESRQAVTEGNAHITHDPLNRP